MRLQFRGIQEQALPQILPERALALCLGQPPEVGEIVGLHAVEIVFGLRVDRAEHGIGVGLTLDVRDAPVITRDRHLRRRGNICSPEYECGSENGSYRQGQSTNEHARSVDFF